jgi:hypothetical protein
MKIALAALIALLTAVPARAGVWIGFEGYLSDGVDYRIEPDPRREGELQAYGRVMGAYGRACQQHLQWCLDDLTGALHYLVMILGGAYGLEAIGHLIMTGSDNIPPLTGSIGGLSSRLGLAVNFIDVEGV